MLAISVMLGTNSNRSFNNVESHSVPRHDSIGTLAQLQLLYIMKAKSLLRQCPCGKMHTKYPIGQCYPLAQCWAPLALGCFNNVESHSVPNHAVTIVHTEGKVAYPSMSLRQYAYELPNWSMLAISVMLGTISDGVSNNVESHSVPNHDISIRYLRIALVH